MTNHWNRYHRHWQLLRPPLRPDADVIACVRGQMDDAGLPSLLLGSTAEYAALGPRLIAMDVSLPMMSGLWVTGSEPRRAGIQGDWTRMPIRAASLSHVLGDGSLNSVPSDTVLAHVLEEVTRVLHPGGKLIARVFCRPATAESMAAIRDDVSAGRVASFHDLKWRIAMTAASSGNGPDIAVQDIRKAVLDMFPDRARLCAETGWCREEVETIEVYAGSSAVYNFPTVREIQALLRRYFTDVSSIRCGTYPLAERCPIIVARNAA